jgi:hypothetical protein
MTMTPEGKLEAVTDGERLIDGGATSPPDATQGSTIAYHSRTITGRVVHVRSSALPEGGIVLIYTDVSDLVGTAEALGRSLAELRAKDGHGRREVGELTGRGSDRGVAADVPTGRPWRRLEVHRTVDE